MDLLFSITVGAALGFVVSLALDLVSRTFDWSPVALGILSFAIAIIVPGIFVFDGTVTPFKTAVNQWGAVGGWVVSAVATSVMIQILWPRRK